MVILSYIYILALLALFVIHYLAVKGYRIPSNNILPLIMSAPLIFDKNFLKTSNNIRTQNSITTSKVSVTIPKIGLLLAKEVLL